MSSTTTVGPSLTIKGEMSADEDVTIEGHMEGLLNLTRSLHIGKSGIVEADVRASSVAVHGRLIGNVIADEKVELFPSCRLEGNIKAPKISMHEGAQFKGNMDMGATIETPSATPLDDGGLVDGSDVGQRPGGPSEPLPTARSRPSRPPGRS